MKKQFNLFKMAASQLKDSDSKKVRGSAGNCYCSCAYANCGGSSTGDNDGANSLENKISPDRAVC